MNQNPVEDNFVTRFILGIAVIFLMSVGGGAVGQLFSDLSVPYGAWAGTLVGAIAVFLVFTILYRRYDASFEAA
ncbi:hypothetical protein SAMN06269185_0497 [Natronoarchaeum philippinense]|uniref:Uncharacterized protein n=1 Tax=Natronoarchaeum philippinense TaxID=558529 RepID=A0A285N447_NATPI|nr:hypothetical protein [Natronoarchaeum philippinense]SNZ04245.1 hypothetical protein SAMN06269185_0497 [Natronoarchaeum philippinense]